MSDDVKVSDETKPVADAPVKAADPKTFSEEEFKKVIAERDKAKERLRKIEEDEKKAAETKAIEEGRIKEVLASTEAKLVEAEKKAKAYEESQAKLREKALANIKDVDMRKIAEKLPNVEDVVEFSEKVSNNKIRPFTDKSTHEAPPEKEYKNFQEYEKAMKAAGLAQ
jgi:hypothetical protein